MSEKFTDLVFDHACFHPSKRFTETELSAEYWRSMTDRKMGGRTGMLRTKALERFASLPHYDQEEP